MKTLLSFAIAVLGLLGRADGCIYATPLEALAAGGVTSTWIGNGRDQLTLTVQNESEEPLHMAIPAGMLMTAQGTRERVCILRWKVVYVRPHSTKEVALPVVALSAQGKAADGQVFEISGSKTDSRLTGLIKYLPGQRLMPQATAQLAVLALLENLNFAQWRSFLAIPPATQPTPAEVTQAIDALGILRTIAPEKTFALGTDAELKSRALRNPWCRAKAMQLYGIALPASDGAVPPDIGQLLHSKPGDNCPICRQRSEMQASPNSL